MAFKYAQIQATYTTCCFCELPELGLGEPVPMEPSFQFKRAATRLAEALGLENLQMSTRTSGRCATAELNVPCKHRDRQYVRLEWIGA